MKKLTLGFLVALLVIPASAQVVYSSGPTNGNWNAWTINFGFAVSDKFTYENIGFPITGASFEMWLFPGDTLESAELSITAQENGGTSYFDQFVNFTQSNCAGNQYGFDVCNERTIFNGPVLNSGSYWINLQNAMVPSGDPVYWDQNNGPHVNLNSASENTLGTIPSETFSLFGNDTFENGRPAGQSTVPEPGSILLFASGVVGLAGWLRPRAPR